MGTAVSGLEDLAQTVRSLALAAGNLDSTLGPSSRRIMDLATQIHQMAVRSEDPYSLRSAANALETAARAVDSACRHAVEAQRRGNNYAAFLAPGSPGSGGDLPVTDTEIDARTTPNRINLADDVGDVVRTPDFGGYLDVVMHGDAHGAQAAIGGQRMDFTLDQVVEMVGRNASWGNRPIRMMSCSTGQAGYAQELADRLGVPVYAPSDILDVTGGVKTVLNDGVWRRFEPRN